MSTLNREFFKDKIQAIRTEKYCKLPEQFKIIESGAFKDWKELRYVMAPNVEKLHMDAFIKENIKYLIVNLREINIIGDTNGITVINSEDEFQIFSTIFESLDLISNIFGNNDKKSKNIIEETKKVVENSLKEVEKLQNELENSEKFLQDEFNKYVKLHNDYEVIDKKIESLVLKTIGNSTKKMMSEQKEELERCFEEKSEIFDEIKEFTKVFERKMEKYEVIIGDMNEKFQSDIELFQNEFDRLRKDVSDFIIDSEKELKSKLEEVATYFFVNKESVIEQITEIAIERLVEKNPCKEIIIDLPNFDNDGSNKDLYHEKFETVLKLVIANKNVLLKGPAGSGKNIIVEQIAKVLKLKFHYLNDVTDEFKVMGFVDANGIYQETQFFKAFTQGGLMFIDEIDNSDPSALLAINAAIGTGVSHYMAFPNGQLYKAHPDFRLVAAANTFGTGADLVYTGRNALDGASINRFIFVEINYDKNIERALIRNKELLNFLWIVRELISKNKYKIILSTRNIQNAEDLLASDSFSMEQIFEFCVIREMNNTQLRTILYDLNNSHNHDKLARKFIDFVTRTRKISLDSHR